MAGTISPCDKAMPLVAELIAAMSGLPRLLLGSAFLSSPFFFILFVLAMTEALDATSAWLAAMLGYAGVVLLFRPLVSGLQAIQAAVHRMSDDETATPEVETLSPTARELWLALARWARDTRATARQRADELSAARAVETALPEPMLLLGANRRIVRANEAAVQLLGDRLVDRDLAGALRHPAVLTAADAVLRGEGLRVVEFESPARSSATSRRGSRPCRRRRRKAPLSCWCCTI